MTIEKLAPLPEISKQIKEARIIRGDPDRIIESCQNLSWKKPARLWTFKAEAEPQTEKLKAFMDMFENVFSIHESEGDYRSAWWTTSEQVSGHFIFKRLFADLNPSTGPDFIRRAADGPRIAIWFGTETMRHALSS